MSDYITGNPKTARYSIRLCHAPDEHERVYFETLDEFRAWARKNPRWSATEEDLKRVGPHEAEAKPDAEIATLRARVAELEGALNRAALQIHSALDQLSKHADARDGEDAKVRLSDLHDALIAALAPKETTDGN